jgi:hypothetical protein
MNRASCYPCATVKLRPPLGCATSRQRLSRRRRRRSSMRTWQRRTSGRNQARDRVTIDAPSRLDCHQMLSNQPGSVLVRFARPEATDLFAAVGVRENTLGLSELSTVGRPRRPSWLAPNRTLHTIYVTNTDVSAR